LKVEAVEAFPIRVKMKEDLRGGAFAYGDYQTVLVRAVCDGVEGWGEAMSRFDPDVNALMVRYLAAGLLGKEYPDVGSAWEQVWKQLRVRGHTRGSGVEALSGIEIAIQDARGKAMGRPLGKLLSDDPRTDVRAFAGSLFESRGSIGKQVEEAVARGLVGAKVKVGFGPRRDLELLTEVRKAWPEGMLVADANGAYDGAKAAEACRAFEGLGLAWFEEPVPSDDWDGYASLRGLGVRVGGGESWFAGDFHRPIAEGLVDVLEPSISRCGGVGVEFGVAKEAEVKRLGFSPMTGMNSGISLAASLHVASASSTEGVEFNPFPNPLQTEMVEGLADPKGGAIRVPTGPGLGVDVDMRFVRKHTA
jgi:L-alanine-DL-glutamate epimerase-like enolase superfamily enzyme